MNYYHPSVVNSSTSQSCTSAHQLAVQQEMPLVAKALGPGDQLPPSTVELEPVGQAHEESLQSLRVTFVFRSVLANSTCWARLLGQTVSALLRTSQSKGGGATEAPGASDGLGASFPCSAGRFPAARVFLQHRGQCASPSPTPSPGWIA